jgi:DHA1 family bicyclomycin/chloramphenicol resistance-like MFS transporter
MAGTFIAGRFTTQLGIDPLVRLGTFIIMVAGTLMMAFVMVGYMTVSTLLAPMIIYMFGFGLMHPNAMAGAIGPQVKRVGAASALLGFIQLGSASGVGVTVGHALRDNATPMVIVIFLSGIASFAAFLLLVRPTEHSRPADTDYDKTGTI